MNKEEWIENFEKENGRKPTPSEFVEAKKNKVFDDSLGDTEKASTNVDTIFEEDTPILEDVDSDEKLSTEEVSVVTVYCFNCGKQNPHGTVQCNSCGVKLSSSKELKSFFSDWGTKLTEVTAIATQKTKELTHNAQVNRYLYSEKRKRENLVLALGNAYYEKYKEQEEADFQELLSEINKIDIIIKGIKDSKGI